MLQIYELDFYQTNNLAKLDKNQRNNSVFLDKNQGKSQSDVEVTASRRREMEKMKVADIRHRAMRMVQSVHKGILPHSSMGMDTR